MLTRTFLLVALSLATILAVGCGEGSQESFPLGVDRSGSKTPRAKPPQEYSCGLDQSPDSCLWNSADLGSVDMARSAIRRGADINMKYPSGTTALHHAVWFTVWGGANAKIVKLLIDEGADINVRNDSGKTPLNTASGRLNVEAVKLLLDAGADPNLLETTGFEGSNIHNTLRCVTTTRTALSNPPGCGVYGQPKEELLAKAKEIIRLLLEHGANPNVKPNVWLRRTPLIEVGANLTTEDDLARLLIEHGADPNLTDEEGKTALDYAYERKDNVYLIDGSNIYGTQVYNYLSSIAE